MSQATVAAEQLVWDIVDGVLNRLLRDLAYDRIDADPGAAHGITIAQRRLAKARKRLNTGRDLR